MSLFFLLIFGLFHHLGELICRNPCISLWAVRPCHRQSAIPPTAPAFLLGGTCAAFCQGRQRGCLPCPKDGTPPCHRHRPPFADARWGCTHRWWCQSGSYLFYLCCSLSSIVTHCLVIAACPSFGYDGNARKSLVALIFPCSDEAVSHFSALTISFVINFPSNNIFPSSYCPRGSPHSALLEWNDRTSLLIS